MKKLDKFIIKGFIGPFFAILVVVIFILMMQFLWLYIDELVGKGLGLKIVLEFMMWGGCTIMPLALPLATLLASMMTLGQMGEHNELMAIKAAGISLTRVLIPLTVLSVLISIGAYFVGNNLVPKAFNEIYTLRDDIGRTKNEIKIPAGTFYDGIDGYILRVNSQDDESGMMHGVMVYDHSSNKGNTSLTLADSALMKMSRNKDYLTFTLFNGSNYQETNTKKYRDTTLELQHIDFSRQELIIPLSNYAFQKSDSSRFGDQVKSMNTRQLAHERDSLNELSVEAHQRHYSQMTHSSSISLRAQVDTSIRYSREEEPVLFKDASFMKWKDIKKEIKAHEKAIGKARDMAADLRMKDNDVYEYNFFLRRINIEYLKKFAQALACLLLFFIGAPLGALIRKGGLGTSAIISVLFFVLYWVVDISGTKLARDGAVAAPIGAFISALVLGPIGAFLSWKAVHDSTLLEGNDALASWWRKAKSKVARWFHPTRIVFMGTPEFAVASLDALMQAGYKVVGVVTVADKPSGRGQLMHESAVKKYAVEHEIPVLQPLKLKDPEFLSALAAWKADLFVVVAFRMLPQEVWSMPRLGTFNLHAALLPQYRGAAPINWAVINGERHTGVTTFMIDKDIDTGGIILRTDCLIGPEDTAGDVHDRLMEMGAKLVVETTEGLIQHNVETRVQRSFIQGSEVLHPAPKLTKENTRIDWNRPAREIYNLIRGLSPYPAAWTTLVREDAAPMELKVFFAKPAAEALPSDNVASRPLPSELGPLPLMVPGVAQFSEGKASAAVPGTIRSDGKCLLVACADGWLEISELQLAGKKRMKAADFLRGFRDPESFRAV